MSYKSQANSFQAKYWTMEVVSMAAKSRQEIEKVVAAQHKLWLNKQGGAQAVFQSVILSGCDFSGLDLQGACFSGCVLEGANFDGCNLTNADFSYSRLQDASMRRANMKGANFTGANLKTTDLTGATMPDLIVPATGDFIGWKRATGIYPSGPGNVYVPSILKLLIPNDAKRTGSYIGRKCRAQFAKVIAAYNLDGTESKADFFRSLHDYNFMYRVGETVMPDMYNEDPRVECASGIHFFMTKGEAEKY